MDKRLWNESGFFDIPNLENSDDEVNKSDFEELLEEFPNAANLADVIAVRQHQPIITGANCLPNDNTFISKKDIDTKDADNLPSPIPFSGEHFTVLDYLSEEYAAAETLEDAIKMRGQKAFFQTVAPEDFAPDAKKITKLGISELWFQSTWHISEENSRNIEEEQLIAGLKENDVFVLGRTPQEKDKNQNWIEINDLGFGFYKDGQLLPFTPGHDYELLMFEDIIKTLQPGEWIECLVRDSTCYGGDAGDVPVDPDFCWRIYVYEVTVYKVQES